LHRAFAVLPLAMVLGLLAACSGGGTATSDASKAANDKAAVRFVACLTDQGQTAKIVQPKGTDQAMVGILQPSADAQGSPSLNTGGSGSDSGVPMQIVMFHDSDGNWLMGNTADAYPEDGGQRAAWKACAKKVPDFTQPKPNISGGHTITQADAAKASLKFAKCARSNGFPDFADPDSHGQLSLPAGITEDEFRALLTACGAKNSPVGIGFTKESTDGLGFDWMSVMNEFMGQHIKNGTSSGSGTDSTSGSK
jgi:hypothetical protein